MISGAVRGSLRRLCLEAEAMHTDDAEINIAFVMLACLMAAVAGVLVFILV